METERRKQSPIPSIVALVTTLVMVAVFVYVRSKDHGDIEVSQSMNESYIHHVFARDTRRTLSKHSFRDRKLVDAMWTMEPTVSRRLQNSNKKHKSKDAIQQSNIKHSETDDVVVTQIIPSHTDSMTSSVRLTHTADNLATTTPIATQSDTTPKYTETPTSPITTESITTPILTEPGEPEITTEQDPDADPNDTLMLIRHRRGGGQATPTTTDSQTTSVAPAQCGGNNSNQNSATYYVGPTGDCECGMTTTGSTCQTSMTSGEQNYAQQSSLQYTTLANGEYTNDQRAAFQTQFESHYSSLTGFVRVFVLPMTYNSTTNKTAINYIILFANPTDANNAAQSASMTANIVRHVLPVTIGDQAVTFGVNETFLVQQNDNDTETLVPIASMTDENVCFLYNAINACQNGGQCVNVSGEPTCICLSSFLGRYCSQAIQFAQTDDDMSLLNILLPVLAAAAVLTALCSCCFFFFRRATKGDEDYVEYSESSGSVMPRSGLILPRYYPTPWKQFIPGSEMEEAYETHTNYSMYSGEVAEVAPMIVERPVIQPVIVEKIIVQERPVQVRRPVRVERYIKEEIIRRPIVMERVVEDVHSPIVSERVVPEAELRTSARDDIPYVRTTQRDQMPYLETAQRDYMQYLGTTQTDVIPYVRTSPRDNIPIIQSSQTDGIPILHSTNMMDTDREYEQPAYWRNEATNYEKDVRF